MWVFRDSSGRYHRGPLPRINAASFAASVAAGGLPFLQLWCDAVGDKTTTLLFPKAFRPPGPLLPNALAPTRGPGDIATAPVPLAASTAAAELADAAVPPPPPERGPDGEAAALWRTADSALDALAAASPFWSSASGAEGPCCCQHQGGDCSLWPSAPLEDEAGAGCGREAAVGAPADGGPSRGAPARLGSAAAVAFGHWAPSRAFEEELTVLGEGAVPGVFWPYREGAAAGRGALGCAHRPLLSTEGLNRG